MLSDKLGIKGSYVQKRDEFVQLSASWQQAFMPDDPVKAHEFMMGFQHLLVLNAELAQAPVLFTLQSAAEVGFAHAQLTPAPESTKAPQGYQPTTTEAVADALGVKP